MLSGTAPNNIDELTKVEAIPQYPQCVLLQDGRGCYTQKDNEIYGLIGHNKWAQIPTDCKPLLRETAIPIAYKNPEKHYQQGQSRAQ